MPVQEALVRSLTSSFPQKHVLWTLLPLPRAGQGSEEETEQDGDPGLRFPPSHIFPVVLILGCLRSFPRRLRGLTTCIMLVSSWSVTETAAV